MLDKILHKDGRILLKMAHGDRGSVNDMLRRAERLKISLAGAYFRDLNLECHWFQYLDLRDADFRGANLTMAHFYGADLRGADFEGANINEADFDEANINTDNPMLRDVPVVPDLDIRIEEITRGDALDMNHWHSRCGTSHCRAGWAIHLAGERGHTLEARVGPATAAALIYRVSTGRDETPDFYMSTEKARADIVACADKARAAKAVSP